MFYFCAHWLDAVYGGVTADYPVAEGRELRLRFYIRELWSRVAHENKGLHVAVLPGWWTEASVDAAGNTTRLWASCCLWRHFRYALDPGTMIFHHKRLVHVFTKPESIPCLWTATGEGTPSTQPRSNTWRAQVKTFNTIERLRRNRWLKAVRVLLLKGFDHVEGSTDVATIILDDLEQWARRDTSGRYTMARYVLDEGVEEALYATYSYAPSKRCRLF